MSSASTVDAQTPHSVSYGDLLGAAGFSEQTTTTKPRETKPISNGSSKGATTDESKPSNVNQKKRQRESTESTDETQSVSGASGMKRSVMPTLTPVSDSSSAFVPKSTDISMKKMRDVNGTPIMKLILIHHKQCEENRKFHRRLPSFPWTQITTETGTERRA
jgi:hypothetical protein